MEVHEKLTNTHLSVSEVAKKVDRSIYTIHHWIQRGYVETKRQGPRGMYYVEIDSLIAYLGDDMAKVCGLRAPKKAKKKSKRKA